jgi:hypothetical protein
MSSSIYCRNLFLFIIYYILNEKNTICNSYPRLCSFLISREGELNGNAGRFFPKKRGPIGPHILCSAPAEAGKGHWTI